MRPDEQVFEGILSGWATLHFSRNLDCDLLAHVSPAVMEHVDPHGTYRFR